MQALTRLQHWLEGVYEIRIDHDVADFVITNPDLAQQLHGSAGRGDCPEKLLVREVQDELNVSLYLAPEIVGHLARVSDSRPRADGRTFCLAIEGVSHFLYLLGGPVSTAPLPRWNLNYRPRSISLWA